MVVNTRVGVLRAIVIVPSCLDFTVAHRLLRQTSTCLDRGHEELYDEHRAWIMEPSEVIHMPEQRGNRTSGFHARDNANNRIVMPVHSEEKCSKNRLSMEEP